MLSAPFNTIECSLPLWRESTYQSPLSVALFVAAYLLCAVVLLRTAPVCRKPAERWFWRICGAVCFGFAFNEPFDLHMLLLSSGECLARAQGWHDHYLSARMGFAIAVTALFVLVPVGIYLAARRHVFSKMLMVAGIALVIGIGAIELVTELALNGITPRGLAWQSDSQQPIRFLGIMLILLAAIVRQLAGRARGAHRQTADSSGFATSAAFQPRRR